MSLKRRIEKLEHQQRGDESLTFTWQEFLHALCTLDRKWCKRRAKEPGGRTALIAMLLLKWLPHLSKAGRATGVSPCFCTCQPKGLQFGKSVKSEVGRQTCDLSHLNRLRTGKKAFPADFFQITHGVIRRIPTEVET